MRFYSIILSLITFCAVMLPGQAEAGKALLVTHYGSSDSTTISRSLSPITAEIASDHPDLTVVEAYISPVVRRNLLKQGIRKLSPTEALMQLHLDGVDTVYIQSSTIIDGAEMQSVRDDAAALAPFFSMIRIGEPLLYSIGDQQKLAGVLAGLYPVSDKRSAVIFVGHGNQFPSTAAYALLDHTLHASGRSDLHVSTIEGAPDVEATARLLPAGLKKITLVPLLLVAGNHTRRDIDGEFRQTLRHFFPGVEINTIFSGLAENSAVRALYRAKATTLLTN